MLVWLGQDFKAQFLPLLTTDASKALAVIKFLTVSLKKWHLLSLKIPSSIPSPFAVSTDASPLPAPTLPCWTPPFSKNTFIRSRGCHWPKLDLLVTGPCPGFSGDFWKHLKACHRAATSHGTEREPPACIGRELVCFQEAEGRQQAQERRMCEPWQEVSDEHQRIPKLSVATHKQFQGSFHSGLWLSKATATGNSVSVSSRH